MWTEQTVYIMKIQNETCGYSKLTKSHILNSLPGNVDTNTITERADNELSVTIGPKAKDRS